MEDSHPCFFLLQLTMSPSSIPNSSLITLANGAKQLVVHEALLHNTTEQKKKKKFRRVRLAWQNYIERFRQLLFLKLITVMAEISVCVKISYPGVREVSYAINFHTARTVSHTLVYVHGFRMLLNFELSAKSMMYIRDEDFDKSWYQRAPHSSSVSPLPAPNLPCARHACRASPQPYGTVPYASPRPVHHRYHAGAVRPVFHHDSFHACSSQQAFTQGLIPFTSFFLFFPPTSLASLYFYTSVLQ